MKKLISCVILVMCLVSAQNTFAVPGYCNFDATNWRWRNDDGTEVGATWKAEAATPIIIAYGSTNNIRLRVCIWMNAAPIDARVFTHDISLQYSPQTPSTNNTAWFDIQATHTTQAFVMAPSPWVNNSTPTTALLATQTGQGSVFVPNYEVASPGTNVPVAMTGDPIYYTNVEFCFRPTTNCCGNIYYFRLNGLGYVLEGPSCRSLVLNDAFAYLLVGPMPGDGNGDGVVNEQDLNIVISNFGRARN